MRLKLITYLICLIVVSIARLTPASAKECTINGELIFTETGGSGLDKTKPLINVQVGVPIDGLFYNELFPHEVPLDKDGKRFEITFPLVHACVIPVWVNGRRYLFYAEPEIAIDLKIEVVNNIPIGIRDTGKLAHENTFFIDKVNQRRTRHVELMRHAEKIYTMSDTAQWLFLDSCRMYRDALTQSLDSLSDTHDISEKFYNLTKVQLQYMALALPLFVLVHQRQDYDRNDPPTEMFLTVADSLFSLVAELDTTYIGINGSLFLGAVSRLRRVRYPDYDYGDFTIFKGAKDGSILPEPFGRWSLFNSMVYQYQNGSPEFSFHEAFQAYRKHFPEDGLYAILDSLDRMIEERPVKYVDPEEEIPAHAKNYKFYYENGRPTVGYTAIFDSFDSLIVSSNRGKAVFIDFWATWCRPCIAEFKHNKDLVARLKELDVGVVYISIDKEDDRKKWENMARSFRLEGSHILISKDLFKKISEEFDLKTIPRYMLAAADGRIILPEAGRPSEMGKLLEEIKEKIAQ